VKGYGRYSQAYQKAAVGTMDQRRLIVMLYDGAIKFLSTAVEKMEEEDRYEAHRNLIKGKSIIAELLASLNMEQGGEIARNLQRLYTYMFNELIEANLEADTARIRGVAKLMRELRNGWKEMDLPNKEQAPAQKVKAPSGATVRKINIKG